VSQRAAIELNHISDNNDATENIEESQKTSKLDVLLSSKLLKYSYSSIIVSKRFTYVLIVQNEPVLTTSKTCGNGIQHIQSNSHSNDKPINRDLDGELFYF
jgi:hypothetical protein